MAAIEIFMLKLFLLIFMCKNKTNFLFTIDSSGNSLVFF